MVPAANAAAITSAVGSVNQASLGASTSILVSIASTPVSIPLEISSYPNSAQAPVSTETRNEPINMPEVHKSPIISAAPKNPQLIHKEEITQSPFLQNSPPLSTQLIPTAIHPTANYGPFSSLYHGNPLGNMQSPMLASPYHGIPGYSINLGNPTMPYIPSYGFGASGFPMYPSHHYGSFTPTPGSSSMFYQSSLPLQNYMQCAAYDLPFNSTLTSSSVQPSYRPTITPQASSASNALPSSSPIQVEGDPVAVLQEYFDWQVIKNLSQEL